MKQASKRQQWWLLVLVGAIIPLTLLLGNEFDLAQRIVVPVIIVTALVFGSMAIWMRANANATGDEWWQDDSSTGWRGY
jgi:undecaprenyl pyrophosphate phosphatase UppP